MKKYCDSCGKYSETIEKIISESYTVLGESIITESRVLHCTECGSEVFCEELDNDNLLNAYNIYRKKHKLLLPSEIKEIRNQYGLSQRSFSALLNWGDKTIFRYENGSVQDYAHNSLLVLLKNPENMRTYLENNDIRISGKKLSDLKNRLNSLIASENSAQTSDILKSVFEDSPSIDNGFKSFDYDKLSAMVVYFATNLKDLLKVKLLKLLNYADMIYYKENGVSLSGLRYVHLPYGPVPDNYEVLFSILSNDKIAYIEVECQGDYEYNYVRADAGCLNYELSEKEIDVLERVLNKFKDFSSKKISDYSHREKGYASTKCGEVIPYSFAEFIDI